MNITVEKAKITVKEMLRDRGYKKTVEDDYTIVADDSIIVYFSTDEKINKDNIQNFTSKYLQANKIKHGIFVYPNTITSTAKNLILNRMIDGIYIELFHLTVLQYNITRHRLVPKHLKLEGEELQEIKSKYAKNLPKLSIMDPVSRYYDFSRGDIIKIYRNTGSSTDLISYRVVV
jgi:DNA-directed RNA polymerase I, II, and III subunit RPABC1